MAYVDRTVSETPIADYALLSDRHSAALVSRDGSIVWEHTTYTGIPKIKRHPKSTHANSTLATDGKHLVAFFGSEGLYAYNLTGQLLWKKDLGVLDAGFFVAPEAQWSSSRQTCKRDRFSPRSTS